MKIRIPPINQVHKHTSTLKNVKNRFRFWQSSAKLGAGLRCQNDAKTKFSVTLHALVPVPDFPLPSNRSRDTWTGAGGKGVTIGDASGLHIEFDT